MKTHLAFVAAIALCTGCSTPSHVVFQQTAVLGVDVTANSTTGQVNVALGYDRQTNALVPKTQTYVTPRPVNGVVATDTKENEAMATLSASRIKIKWLGTHEVNEQFATGEAAVNIARRPDAVASLSTLSEEEKK